MAAKKVGGKRMKLKDKMAAAYSKMEKDNRKAIDGEASGKCEYCPPSGKCEHCGCG